MDKPLVALFSDANPLSLSIVENLLANFCRVAVFTKEVRPWQEKTFHLKKASSLEVLEEKMVSKFSPDYLIFVDLEKMRNVESITKTANIKSLFVSSCHLLSKQNPGDVQLGENIGVIYLGDIFGPRMDLEESFPLSKILKAALTKREVNFKGQTPLYPVFIPDVAKTIVKWLFSFGPYGEEVFVSSKPISFWTLASIIKRFLPETNFVYREENTPVILPQNIRKVVLRTNLEFALKETVSWFIKYQPEDLVRKHKDHQGWKKIISMGALVLFLISPFILSAISASALLFAKKEMLGGRVSLGKVFLSIGKNSALIDKKESFIFSQVPLLGKIYEPNTYLSSALVTIADIGSRAISITETTGALSSKILGDKVYNPEPYSEKLSLELDYLYKEISFLEGEPFVSKIIKNATLNKTKMFALYGKDFAGQLPQILGAGRPVTYLILFQNNMELRPTGGFIGSYALVTFDGGRLTDVKVEDVYSADGQLKGHVEPPSPIKNYLGEAGWYLRDANWDPDFPTTAAKIEWFLDKEIDKSVDGVVGVDLELAKTLLKETGPIFLSDFNAQITSQNLYEKTQSEVESNFFPGSRKKASYLTSLTRELLTKVTKFDEKDYLPLTKAVFSSLEERHIQVFLHNRDAQKAIANFGFDGAVSTPSCSGSCFSDWLGIVEANVGVNKANYFVKRKANLSVFLDRTSIRRELSLSLENTANPAVRASDKYKVYIRILAPASSEFENALVIPEIGQLNGRKEAGFLIEVPAGQKRTVVVRWKDTAALNFNQRGEYRLYWRKQAGVGEDPISINFSLPAELRPIGEPALSLTESGTYGYNTNLARDSFSRVSWTNKF